MPRRDVSMTPDEIQAFLAPVRVGVLATVGSDAWPHLSAMWFVPHEGELQMWTYARSQKAINARREPRATFLIEDGTRYQELKGVSISGVMSVFDDYDRVRSVGIALYERYTQPHLGIALDDGPLEEIEKQARKRVGLALRMDRVASWDHSKLA